MSQTLLTMHTTKEMAEMVAGHVKTIRLQKNLTRKTLASRAGVSVASLIRFETTGKASFALVLKIAHALDRLMEFERLLKPPPARSIEELESRVTKPIPKRGRI